MLSKLMLENRRLRRRVTELEDKLGIDSETESEGGKANAFFTEMTNACALYKNRNYFSYLTTQLKRTALWSKTGRVVKYSKFYLFLSRSFKTFIAITTWLQTSAAFIIVATASITVLPILFVLSSVVLISTFIYRNKYNRLLSDEIGGRTVAVYIAVNQRCFEENSCFLHTVRETAKDQKKIVFVVTPYFWSLRGLGGRGAFACARKEGENIWLVRNYYFFFFRRTVLKKLYDRIIYIY